jgi:D-alanine-D-alanine ligase
MKPIIALLEGGYTREAVISQQSADTIHKHIDHDLFDVYRVKILPQEWQVLVNDQWNDIDRADFSFIKMGEKVKFDAVFNMVHGNPGENGIIQAYFDLLNLPYTGGDVLNMALTFNKKATTTALGYRGFKVAKSIALRKSQPFQIKAISSDLQLPIFVKPNTAGSSLGISKVTKWEDIETAIVSAFEQSDEVIIEEMMTGTEVTSGVIKLHGKITALPVTEIVCANDFFDYDAKYEADSTQEITPARISKEMYEKVQRTAELVYDALNCAGFVRVDFILQNDEPCIIEVNTIPGMSKRSLVPQQMAYANISLTTFITDLLTDILPK